MVLTFILILFPFVFVTLWLAVTTLLGRLSGWFGLQEVYPDRDEQPLCRLNFQSGSLRGGGGLPIGFRGCLRFDACPTGLRVSVWRIFGLFQRPFFVPWQDIAVAEKRAFFMPMVRLTFARWPGGEMTTHARSWQRIAASPMAGLVKSG